MKREQLFLLGLLTLNFDMALADEVKSLDVVSVTANREATSLAETPASVGVVDSDDVDQINPGHSAELLNHIPGVNVVQLGSSGQGVAVQIRQPISYGPVYLYLENGVPTRSAGFFNHNALYEVNTASADGAEVFKGPGSALYGSEAVGGIVNILSGQKPEQDMLRLGIEAGEYDWLRTHIKSKKVTEKGGFTADLDITSNEGWREHTDFEKQAFTTSWHTEAGDGVRIGTVLTGTVLDMNTGGSGLLKEDFDNDPDQPGNLIGYRDVRAFRLSSAIEKDIGENGLLSVNPFVRSNDLEYIATWTLNSGREAFDWRSGEMVLDSQDAHVNQSGHNSVGALIKYRLNTSDKTTIISGLDLEYTQGYQKQTYIVRTDNTEGSYWLNYSEAGLLYDYDVDFTAASPYVQLEHQYSERFKVQAGLRYDSFEYDYDNKLSVVTADDLATPDIDEGLQLRPEDTEVTLDHFSPKLSFVYALGERAMTYGALRHGFRIPTSGQLFRSGKTADSTNLDPVKVNSAEVGIRGDANDKWSYEAALYYMEGKDDIVSVTDAATGARHNENAGETRHSGIELGSGYQITPELKVNLAYSYAKHKYEDWGDLSGNEIPLAPQDNANIQLAYEPDLLNGGQLVTEWAHQGEYFIDEDNDNTYSGHRLYNVRANYFIGMQLEVYAKVQNLTDVQWAETASKWGPKFTPGKPRTALIGAKYTF